MSFHSGDAAAEASLLALLDAAAAEGQAIRFWWRDDDAEAVTSALERLLALAGRHALPLGLAVIPQGATPALAARLAEEPRIAVLQHGWRHANHAPPGGKKMELGADRPLPEVLGELAEGRARLDALFGPRFLPVLVPPWNKAADSVLQAAPKVGLSGLSTLGPVAAGGKHQANVHVDLIDWKARAPLPRPEIVRRLAREIERRLAGDAEPIGIMSHHLAHGEETWDCLDALFGCLARHPGVTWPPVDEVFGLAPENLT